MSDESEPRRIPWSPIQPLALEDRLENGSLAALGALRAEWQRYLETLTEEDRSKVRQRTLRRLAVETGILERLYEIEWGLTLTLVAEGFARDVVERAGGAVDERVLATLRAQRDSLEMVLDFVRSERRLGPSFIKELHAAITRTQLTYEATDTLGRVFDKELVHGEWKRVPNHVRRADDTILEYAPPEQVESEVDRLIELYAELEASNTHPIVKAAWLHHRFVQIHPFADGNGRAARALTLLVLEKDRYAPLVVDRWHRDSYIAALDAANDGSLRKLIQLFIRLESSALTSELDRPEPVAEGMSLDVAHTLASQLAALQRRRDAKIRDSLRVRALSVAARMRTWFERKQRELTQVFRNQGIRNVEIIANTEMPPNSQLNQWFHAQIIESARKAGHYADFELLTGWCSLRLKLQRVQLRYVASLHGAGREGRVMAVTTFGHLKPLGEFDPEEGSAKSEAFETTKDAFRFVHTESAEELDKRGPELEELLDEGLAEAMAQLLKRV